MNELLDEAAELASAGVKELLGGGAAHHPLRDRPDGEHQLAALLRSCASWTSTGSGSTTCTRMRSPRS